MIRLITIIVENIALIYMQFHFTIYKWSPITVIFKSMSYLPLMKTYRRVI